MSDKIILEKDNPLVTERTLGPGIRLRQARDAAGLSEEDVAKSLYLTVTHVQALETDDYHNSPGFTFERGYLRAYARLLSLPEDSIIADFNRLGLEEKNYQPAQIYGRKYSGGKPKHGHWLIYLAILAMSILIITWWQIQNSPSNVLNPDKNPSVVHLDAKTDINGDLKEGTEEQLSSEAEQDPVVAQSEAPASLPDSPETATGKNQNNTKTTI